MPIEEMAPRPPSAAPHAVHPIACVKMEHSLSSTEIEDSSHDDDPLSSCRDSAVAVVAYLSSLARSAGPERPGRPGGFNEGNLLRFLPSLLEGHVWNTSPTSK